MMLRILSLPICFLLLARLQADVKSTSGSIDFDRNGDGQIEARLDSNGLSLGSFSPSANLHVKGNVILESGNVWLGNSYQTSSIEFGGTIGQRFTTLSTDTTLSISDASSLFLIDSSSDNITVTLPYAGNVMGRQYQFKKISTANFVRIASTESIDGFDSQLDMSFPSNGLSSVKLMSNGNTWFVLDKSNDVVQVVAAANLIGWWKLDETSGTLAADSSGLGNHGVLGGAGATFSDNNVIGVIQGGMNFDSKSNYIDITNFNGLSTSQITVSCWAYLKVNVDWNRYVNHEWVNNGWLLYSNSAGAVYFGIGQGAVQSNAISANSVVVLEQWFFLAGTYDGANVKVYMNGSLVATTAKASATLDNVGAVDISKNLNGYMDDVRIYSRALTAGEILQLYRGGLN